MWVWEFVFGRAGRPGEGNRFTPVGRRTGVPTTTADDGTKLYYEEAGDGESVVFIGEAGLGAWQWGWQHGHITGPYRTVVWDLRGTGRSGEPTGPYDVETLAGDLECVLSATTTAGCHLIGAGLGGMVAMQYAHEYSRAKSLTLFNTASSGQAVDQDRLRELCTVSEGAARPESALSVGFSEQFLSANTGVVSDITGWRREEDATADGLSAQLAAMVDFEAPPLYEITQQTLVCHAIDDPVIDIDHGRTLGEALPRGTFQALEGRHLAFIEHSRPVTDRVLGFLHEETGHPQS